MARIAKRRLVKGPYKPICRDCAIDCSIHVDVLVFVQRLTSKSITTEFILIAHLEVVYGAPWCTTPKTNSYPLKIDAWKMKCPFKIFSVVSFLGAC